MAITVRIFNCVNSRDTQDDWKISKAKALGYIPKRPKIPSKVDLRHKDWNIGDQGTSGSCVGWASTDSLLRYHFAKAKKIRFKDNLSVRFIWMSAKETDEYVDYPTTFIDDAGTSLKTALKVAHKYGVLTAKQLPFEGNMLKIKEKNFLEIAGRMKIKAYFNLSAKKAEKIELFKLWLAYHGPILTCLDCDSSWFDVKSDGLLTKYDKSSIDPENPSGHAVSIVGYTPTHFIIRNSWGKGWGKNGFAFASYDYVLDAYKEAYGIVI